MTTEQPIEAKARPLLSPENKLRYVAALNFLVGELSLTEWKPLGVSDFLLQYNVKPSFIDALRDLDCLILSFVKEDHYKKTDKLIKISPEEVLQQMRRNGPKSGRKEEIESIEFPVGEPFQKNFVALPPDKSDLNNGNELLSIEMPERSEGDGYAVIGHGYINDDGTGGVIFKDPKQLIDEAESKQPTVRKPYTVSLTAKGLDLTIEVDTPADAALLSGILSNLNQ